MQSGVNKPVKKDLIGNVERFDELANEIISEIGGKNPKREIIKKKTVAYFFDAQEGDQPYKVTLAFTGKRILYYLDWEAILPRSVDIFFETKINKMVYDKEINYL